jgi:hypothetical protein
MLRRDLAAGSRAAEPRWVPRPAGCEAARAASSLPLTWPKSSTLMTRSALEFQAQFGTLQRQRCTADLALQGLRLAGRQRLDAQLQARAAVVEAALVERVALVDERLVDLDAGAALAVGVAQQHLAGEQLRHAGVVVLDDEASSVPARRAGAADAAAGQVDARDLAACRPRARRGCRGRPACSSPARWRGPSTAPLPSWNGVLALQAHGGLHEQVAVQQAAQADQHDGAMRGQVAELVHLALARRQQRALGRARRCAPASRLMSRRCSASAGAAAASTFKRPRRGGVGTQRLRADRQLGVAPVARDLGRLAGDAQAGAE